MAKSQRIGLCTVIAVLEMQVITYAMDTYELALAQAKELQKGVKLDKLEVTNSKQENGLRQQIHKYPEHFQLVVVQEIEISKTVLPVED